ncbi:MAG TPA: 23S rRNA (adenine(2503)-C(2))-methyltransferase RlmN [Polyangiaceae bacterium]|jgi:23S rRNA (adenine2503-C2)-methyltransferase
MHPPLARTPEEWTEAALGAGGRAFHGKQLFRWIQARSVLATDKMSDLPAALREKLADLGPGSRATVSQERVATDGTRKLLLALEGGATIETVLIPGVSGPKGDLPNPVEEDADASAGDDEDEEGEAPESWVRVTQCISTQVGCAMGCVFCASGVAGLKRNLGADEIIAQVLLGRARLAENQRLRNVVYMGMGEPLANYDATVRSLRLLTHPEGIGLSARRVTVSTSGLVPEIARLGEDFGGNIGLAVSLHAADDEARTRLMPINKKYPLAKLMQALRAYPLPRRRRITIEYTLVAGKNDSLQDAHKVARLLRGLPVKINLIPMNPIEAAALTAPQMSGVFAFQKVLCDAGYSCFIRRRRGDDVSAACGQLALLGAKPKVRVNRA